MTSLRKFPNPEIMQKRKQEQHYKIKEGFYDRRRRLAKEASDGCWWLETFLLMYPNKLKK